MAHPLSGTDLRTVSALFDETGGPDRLADRLAITAAVVARAPSMAFEHHVLARGLAVPRDPAPIFLVGHWRSGTTHLYNLLAAGGFGYLPPVEAGLPWDALGLARLLRPVLNRALPESRWIDAVPVTPTSPQEDEIALASMGPLSFYHALYFPKHFERLMERGLFFEGASDAEIAQWEQSFTLFLAKIAHGQPAPLVMKNPVYTTRIARIRCLVPGARFIHIHRDPVAVVLSMRNFHARLLEAMALQAVPDDLDIERIVLGVYDRMMRAYVEDTANLGPPDLVELSYDTLETDPLGALRTVHEGLDLDGWERARPRYEAYLASVKSYTKNSFARDPEDVRRIEAALAPWFDRWGYARSTG